MLVEAYRAAFATEVGYPDQESPLPVPWFAHNHWNKVQWAAYIGDCQGPGALAFGVNIEFLPVWRKIRPRLEVGRLKDVLEVIAEDLWNWQGRPGYICRNPGVETLYSPQPVADVDLAQWLGDLDEILHGNVKWHDGRPMRPQLQVMRRVGNNSLSQDMHEVRGNIRQAMRDMSPLMNLVCGR
ncbi:MAG: hypothetical protein Q7T82_20605 [Armatimonadota bacterium]|nr:hypothetical protein [Armatimonadota bacterium]